MSTVNLIIGGRDYAVACAPGEEGHVTYLGSLIDEKLDSMPQSSTQNEARALLFAALLLADEVSELRESVAPADPAIGSRLSAIADTLEALASKIEQQA